MAARGPEDDDWFAGIEPREPSALEADPASAEDDWLAPSLPPRRARPAQVDRRVLVVAAGFVVVLLAVLAAAGVFSSGGHKKLQPIVSTPATTVPATTPTTTPRVAALPTTTLKPGDTGAQVRALQRALLSLGYPAGKVDGQYGPTTKTAVAAFQHAAGLTADGIFGPKTMAALIRRAGP
jgi:hypothetical protein